MLRHLKIRDTKTKVLYTLNFFRAVQKRLALDLREYADKEIVSPSVDIQAPQEASYIGSTKSKVIGDNLFLKNVNLKEEDKEKIESSRRSRENNEVIQQKHHVIDIKKWKSSKGGVFNEIMLSTCPVMPSFHSKHGEPMEERGFNPETTDSENMSNIHITNRSSHLLTRMDTFKVDQSTGEIFVIDDYGMHVMFDCSLEDMTLLDLELLKIATYYVKRTEGNFDFGTFKYPFCDRL